MKFKLTVGYDGTFKTFTGNDIITLFEMARKDKLYRNGHYILYDLEEIDNGDKCSKC